MTTRFRAYRLASEGSSYSYFDGKTFTLFEGRYNDDNKASIAHELYVCGKTTIDVLHITSWDHDHCKPKEIKAILDNLMPGRVEVPGYNPKYLNKKQSEASKESWRIIQNWNASWNTIERFSPQYLDGLSPGERNKNTDIIFWPRAIDKDNANNNSTVLLLRGGYFNVLSTGDIESDSSAQALMNSFISTETNVLVLPHHGSEHGIITHGLLAHLSPDVSICTSNRGNKFDHPRKSVRDKHTRLAIPLCTTKMGDVIIECTDGRVASVYDYTWNATLRRYTTQKTRDFFV